MNLNPEEASDKNPLTQAVGGSEDFVATVGARFPSKGATRGAELLSLKNTGLVTQSGPGMRIKNDGYCQWKPWDYRVCQAGRTTTGIRA